MVVVIWGVRVLREWGSAREGRSGGGEVGGVFWFSLGGGGFGGFGAFVGVAAAVRWGGGAGSFFGSRGPTWFPLSGCGLAFSVITQLVGDLFVHTVGDGECQVHVRQQFHVWKLASILLDLDLNLVQEPVNILYCPFRAGMLHDPV